MAGLAGALHHLFDAPQWPWVRFDSNADSNADELGRTLANGSERRRTTRPRTSKPLVGVLGDVDGRIVPVAPHYSLKRGDPHRNKPFVCASVAFHVRAVTQTYVPLDITASLDQAVRQPIRAGSWHAEGVQRSVRIKLR